MSRGWQQVTLASGGGLESGAVVGLVNFFILYK